MQPEIYDFIIVGAGAAGLSLATALGSDPAFGEQRILLLEQQESRSNDRTWSYWEKGKGIYDPILLKQWSKIRFKDEAGDQVSDISPYTYKTLRALDFYNYHDKQLQPMPHVSRKVGRVTQFKEGDSHVIVHTENNQYSGRYVFSSVLLENNMHHQSQYPVLQQHFVGWYVQSQQAVFDAETATFMDFSIPQKGNTRFMYVLPITPYKGLVEYTLFSKNQLESSEYELAIQDYLKHDLQTASFEILEKEKGSIPMTVYDFSRHNTNRITYIGTAGGWTKPSTGFTFANIQKNTKILVEKWKNHDIPFGIKQHGRHRFYDTLLLDILDVNNEKGREIFTSLFRKRRAEALLDFLGEETTFFEELNMIRACPKSLFLKALGKRML